MVLVSFLFSILFFLNTNTPGTKTHEIYNAWDLNRDGGIDVNEFQTQVRKRK